MNMTLRNPPPVCIYVSASAQGKANGTAADPYPTLGAARDAIRKLRAAEGLPPGGVIVWVQGGEYRFTESLRFSQEDSGSAQSPIVYRAAAGAPVRLQGGARLDPNAFTPVTEPSVRTRLTEAAREHVVQIDLRSQGVADWGAFSSRGFGRPITPSHLELFFNDQPMTVAQWPNAGQFAKITGFTKPIKNEWGIESAGELTGAFSYEGDRPQRWAPSDNIWVHGYWAHDWANSYERVRRLDPVARTVETAPPHGNYSFTKNQRFYFLNILEELDQPGAYYVDCERGILYFWPPAPLAGADILVSVLGEPLLALNDACHLEFHGFTLEAGRGCGIRIDADGVLIAGYPPAAAKPSNRIAGGTGVVIAGCTIRNCGTWAVQIDGGTQHTVAGCEIYGTGDGGIDVNGGDRATLTPCHHAVLNNHIHHFARWSRCYVAGINLAGVGIRIAHNRIHDAPHTAILFWGNDFQIEHNEIYRVCLETGDVGAIYTGRDYTFRGNVIRRNFIHHLGGLGMGSVGIYMDDCVSGTRIEENIFWNCQHGIMLGGGCDFVVANNIFVNCQPAISPDARGLSWLSMVNDTMQPRFEAMRHDQPPYSTRYPELAAVAPYLAAGKGVPAMNNRVELNICWRCRVWLAECTDSTGITERNNLVGIDPGFTGEALGNLSLRPESPAWALGFQPIPLDEIGLVVDRYRSAIPPRVHAALQLRAASTEGEPVPLRLLLRNATDAAVLGAVMVEGYDIANVRLSGETHIDYRLAPGEERAYEFAGPVAPAPTAARNWSSELTVQVHSPDSQMRPAQLQIDWPRSPRASAWFTTGWNISRLQPVGDITAAPSISLAQDGGWTPVPAGNDFVDIHALRGPVGYVLLARKLRVAADGEWILHVGHDGGVRVFMDGQPVAATPGACNPAPRDRTQARVALAAGEHELGIAFDRADGRGWGMFVCFEIPMDRPMHGQSPVFPM